MNFLNSIKRRSGSPGAPKRAVTPCPKGRSPATATTPGTPSPAARTPGSNSSRHKKNPTHGPDVKPLKKSELRKEELQERSDARFEMCPDSSSLTKYRRKQDENEWESSAQKAAEQFMNRYAEMGPEGIRAEFLKEVGDYRNPNTAHKWFDKHPDKNRNKDQITCLDENRVMLPSDKKKYINASWAKIKDPSYQSTTLLGTLRRKYILAQIPLESTMEEYWQMILENQAATVLLLLPEQDEEKFKKFWPIKLDEEKVYGKMIITCIQYETVIEGCRVPVLEVAHKDNKRSSPLLVWFFACMAPTLARPFATTDPIPVLLKLSSLIDHIDESLSEEHCRDSSILIMDECGGTTRASLLLLVDVACELMVRADKPFKIADVFKFAIGCRGGAVLGEEEYLLAVQAVAEHIWRSTYHYNRKVGRFEKDEYYNKNDEEKKELEEQYRNKYAEQYKKIVGKPPGKKWNWN